MVLALCALLTSVQTKAVELTAGATLKATTVVKQAVYKFSNADETYAKSVLTVSGNDITIDFNGAVLEGSAQTTDPDQRKGLGLFVQGNNITIKNLKIRGYKIGLLAKKCSGLRLLDCDFSYNWRAHLQSTVEKEDESDWMSYHHNEADEWFQYGAAAYLKECDKFEVKNLHVTGGQCGLMLVKSNNGLVWNSDMSFNSGLGLGMYRSSNNKILHNKMDWCVRGYSHGVYNRGQDSAGILIFEQCNKNVFAYNSATHGGDGFFLWAGQETMDSGKGGCNDNLLYANDFSHSPANAIEATFSRNKFVNNLLIDSWHGIWGGYSYDTLILGNMCGLNGESVAIEHGQNNMITMNTFFNDTVGVYLWQNASKPDPSWGYPKNKDVRNIGSTINRNAFIETAETAVLLGPSTNLKVAENAIVNAAAAFKITGEQEGMMISKNSITGSGTDPSGNGITVKENSWTKSDEKPGPPWMTRGGNSIVATELDGAGYFARFYTNWTPTADIPQILQEAKSKGESAGLEGIQLMADNFVKPMEGAKSAFLTDEAFKGRKYILMGEWGPYDFQRPLLWPRKKTSANSTESTIFEVLGPKGKWRLVSKSEGVTIDAEEGKVPGKVVVTWPSSAKNVNIALEYLGEKTVDERGVVTAAGEPVSFGYSKSYMPIAWKVSFWPWIETQDPRTKADAYEQLLETKPVATFEANELSFATSGSPYAGVPADHFATTADGKFDCEGGKYSLNVTADDGVRVWLDGKQLIDEWHWEGPTLYTRELDLTKGEHILKVRHFEIDGYTALKVEVKPKK